MCIISRQCIIDPGAMLPHIGEGELIDSLALGLGHVCCGEGFTIVVVHSFSTLQLGSIFHCCPVRSLVTLRDRIENTMTECRNSPPPFLVCLRCDGWLGMLKAMVPGSLDTPLVGVIQVILFSQLTGHIGLSKIYPWSTILERCHEHITF